MFVFHRKDLPLDAVFPADLDKLGYFINDQDQIRKKSDPDQEFQYKINRNDRWNDVQRAAMNECIRGIVLARLRDLGLATLRLPLTSGPNRPHVPILVSKNLSTASRIILLFGEPVQDLGIWAYRTVGAENINAGSAVDFVKAVLYPDENANTYANSASDGTYRRLTKPQQPQHKTQQGDVAVILANTGQLVWHCGTGKAMTLNSLLALPRASAVDPPLAESRRNKIPGHGNWQEHVNSVFDAILSARGQLVREDVKIDVIGLSEGGLGAVRYLGRNWPTWRKYISAMVLATPLHTKASDLVESTAQGSFAAFMSSRCRAYTLSPEPLGFPLPISEAQLHGCNCYSSGEELNAECIMPKAWPHMLNWLKRAYDDENFCEAQLVVHEADGNESALDGEGAQ
ncbi:Arb2 domain-containing protein [Aspergillus unguis]